MVHARTTLVFFVTIMSVILTTPAAGQSDTETLNRYRAAAMASGDAARGKGVFDSKEAACKKCHSVFGNERLAGPDLASSAISTLASN